MFSHVTLGTNDPAKARRFYDAVMPVLGHSLLFAIGDTTAYGEATGPKLFIGPPFNGAEAQPGNGPHLAFIVADRATVDAFHTAALTAGGSDEGAPGPRPQYHPNYYGAYVRDLDGNKLQAVCHSKP
jgi:catechol 2,3-dioxygenase-like lactoylglutathione lyase family enzyme